MHRLAIANIQRDPTGWGVASGALILSVIAYAVIATHGGVLLYTDALSHLTIARRVIEGTNPGLAQLGSVWLPFSHMLTLPLVWINPLYQDGFAGSLASMGSYVICVVAIFKICFRLTANKLAGVAGAGVFALNANVLYLQGTPMTELPLFGLLAMTVYALQRWAETDRYSYLVGASVTAMLATLTRYESWPIVIALALVVITVAWQQADGQPKLRLRRVVDRTTIFCFWAFAGIAGWIIWNWVIFGNPLNFQTGEFSKPSLWTSQVDPAVGHIWIAAQTYWYAVRDTISLPILLLAAIGLGCLVVSEYRQRTFVRTLPLLTVLGIVPSFFIGTLWAGQRPLHVLEIGDGLYNVRFGLIMLVPIAILAGYLVGCVSSFLQRTPLQRSTIYLNAAIAGLVLSSAAAVSAFMLFTGSVLTYAEPLGWQTTQSTRDQNMVVSYMNDHYDNRYILMESFGSEVAAFHLPSDRVVYEGTNAQSFWQSSLRYPADHHIGWIIIHRGDAVDQAITGNPKELTPYHLVYQTPDDTYHVYRLERT